jgi:hypothetical protein
LSASHCRQLTTTARSLASITMGSVGGGKFCGHFDFDNFLLPYKNPTT